MNRSIWFWLGLGALVVGVIFLNPSSSDAIAGVFGRGAASSTADSEASLARPNRQKQNGGSGNKTLSSEDAYRFLQDYIKQAQEDAQPKIRTKNSDPSLFSGYEELEKFEKNKEMLSLWIKALDVSRQRMLFQSFCPPSYRYLKRRDHPYFNRRLSMLLIQRMACEDIVATQKWLVENGYPTKKDWLTENVLLGWAESDPRAALEHYRTLTEPSTEKQNHTGDFKQVYWDMHQVIGKHDPKLACKLVKEAPASEKFELLRSVILGLQPDAPFSDVARLLNLSEPYQEPENLPWYQLRAAPAQCAENLTVAWAQTNPTEAFQWARREVSAYCESIRFDTAKKEEYTKGFMSDVYGNWAIRNPETFIAWAENSLTTKETVTALASTSYPESLAIAAKEKNIVERKRLMLKATEQFISYQDPFGGQDITDLSNNEMAELIQTVYEAKLPPADKTMLIRSIKAEKISR
ncbi:MAG: hypothetical protein ACPG32_08855 [Akkermansiaceae bacterium]